MSKIHECRDHTEAAWTGMPHLRHHSVRRSSNHSVEKWQSTGNCKCLAEPSGRIMAPSGESSSADMVWRRAPGSGPPPMVGMEVIQVWHIFMVGTFSSKLQKNSSKNTFIQKLSSKREDISSTTLHACGVTSGSVEHIFIQKREHPMTLSSKHGFVQ